ncbi:hypothetical protein JTE90_001142 [Oedothorax gibbosus]|uniref:Major facilitator superfamily (MFS) profile domain-containing protein n=1 Tax=Oedothorax gibbosus TaxID=931172 RepID=A0AAV6VH93_9ARAC|nr:hypothetical protein JTE90_001142 [Oedothorax gibbosus]
MGKSGKNSPVRPAVRNHQLLASTADGTTDEVVCNNRTTFQPPDGGWGWVVCLASFWTNGTIFGIMNCFGVLYVKLKDKFAETHEEAAFVTSWVGSVSIGTTFLLSPVASILTDRWGIRTTAFIGGLLATAGMLVSSFVTSLELLYLTYGVLLGSGASLAYTPSLVVLGHYFHRRLGFVNGLVTAGSSVFTMIMPLVLTHLLETVELATTLQILSLMMASLMLCALTFRPLIVQHERIKEDASDDSLRDEDEDACCGKCLDLTIWRNKQYLLWVFAIPVALFGYFVPYVHLVQHVRDILPEANGEILVTCIGLTSGVGRIVFGKLADFPSVNRIMLQQIAFLSIGVLTMVLVVARHFSMLVAVCLFLGLFDGCFISLLGPIAFDVVGQKGASQAIGFLLGFCSVPLTVGPPVAGLLYDHLKNYNVAFLAAGIPPIIGSILLCLIHKIPKTTHALTEEAIEKNITKDGIPDFIKTNDITISIPEKMPLTDTTKLRNGDLNKATIDETTHLCLPQPRLQVEA